MATNYIQDGGVLDHVAGSAISSGDVIVMGVIAGVALTDIASGATGAVQTRGVFSIAKASGAIAQGALVYWDSGNSNVTTTATGNTKIGVAAAAAASGDTTAHVMLNVGL